MQYVAKKIARTNTCFSHTELSVLLTKFITTKQQELHIFLSILCHYVHFYALF